MPRVILKYRSIAHGTMKSIYLEFNPPIHDVKGKSVRYECLNLEIYASPETCQQIKQNKAVEEVAETIRCERYLQLVRSDYSFLAKARLDEDFLEYFRENGDCHGAKYQSSRLHFERFCFLNTFAMQLLDKGVDIYTITALLGHRQVSSTQNYAKISSKKMIEAIVKME